MSDGPGYEMTGEISRFDERDTVFSREALLPGSPEEIEYHRLNPDLAEVDSILSRFILSKMEGGSDVDQLARAIYDANFMPPAALAIPDMVDGTPESTKIEWDPESAAEKIKTFCRLLGADDVRIGPLKQEWVYSNKGSRPFFREEYINPPFFRGIPEDYQGRLYGDPIRLDHPTAISLAFKQEKDMTATGSTRAVDFEVGRIYALSALVSVQIARFIRALGWKARAHHLRNYLVLCVPVAVDSGIGELARCGYVVSRSLGADFRLVTITTDMPLAYDSPVDLGMTDFCSKCQKCATCCPSGAIPKGDMIEVRGVRKWKLNPEACLLYWGKTGYSCSICQTVCPWSKPHNLFHRSVAATAVNIPWMRRALVLGDDLVYGAKFRPVKMPDWLSLAAGRTRSSSDL